MSDDTTNRQDRAGPAAAAILDTATTEFAVPNTTVTTRLEHVELPDGLMESGSRYHPGPPLGAGGFGEVLLCKDARIRRLVAMKVMHTKLRARPEMQIRFLREARVQGQLEHPSIVPVYDLGLTPEGTPFFTMKRVHGVDLETVLVRLRSGDSTSLRTFSQRKLLTAFSNICLAIDFAHQRGVLHRDLKPSNVMLGEFGEVYVLDWGIAKILDEPELASGESDHVTRSPDPPTRAGAVLGTPEYMPPEQLLGHAEIRSDVYGLGRILVDILALQSPQSNHGDPFANRDVAPELSAIARKATNPQVTARFASARELGEAIERYLDGDRDLELRRRSAAEHVARAEQALVAHDRRRASQEVGRALGFDPSNVAAVRLLVRLLTDLPEKPPAEAAAAIEAAEEATTRSGARFGFFAMLATFLFLPCVFWLGIRSWLAFGTCVALMVATLVVMALRGWWARKVARPGLTLSFVLVSCFIAALNSSMGIFGAVPAFAAVTTMAFTMALSKSARVWIVAIGCLSLVAPLAAEWLGLVLPSYEHHAGALWILPRMHQLPQGAILIPLVWSLAVVIASALFAGRYRDALRDSERRIQLQAWQLRQLVPSENAARERS